MARVSARSSVGPRLTTDFSGREGPGYKMGRIAGMLSFPSPQGWHPYSLLHHRNDASVASASSTKLLGSATTTCGSMTVPPSQPGAFQSFPPVPAPFLQNSWATIAGRFGRQYRIQTFIRKHRRCLWRVQAGYSPENSGIFMVIGVQNARENSLFDDLIPFLCGTGKITSKIYPFFSLSTE